MRKAGFHIGRLLQNRIVQHLLFWGLSYLILINILKVSSEIKKIDLIYTLVFHVPVVMIVYLNLKLLFPLYLERARYFSYVLLVILLISLGSGFYLILFDSWIDYIFKGYYFIAYYGFWDISLYLLIYVVLTGLFRLARGWFRLQEMEKEKTLAELKALKSQINPHFLFNSLNSIYSLSRKNSVEVPDKIVQLSDLMRHVLYDSEADYIPLEKEIDMLRNYIQLQNLRTVEKESIKMEIDGDTGSKQIAPLLFLPFVENSFKHGIKAGTKDSFVNIKLSVSDSQLSFSIENSKGAKYAHDDSKYMGIGIENVKKRLELIYPDQHKLNIIENESTFKVDLHLQLTAFN